MRPQHRVRAPERVGRRFRVSREREGNVLAEITAESQPHLSDPLPPLPPLRNRERDEGTCRTSTSPTVKGLPVFLPDTETPTDSGDREESAESERLSTSVPPLSADSRPTVAPSCACSSSGTKGGLWKVSEGPEEQDRRSPSRRRPLVP
jgi:hypothetical protein